MYLIRTTPWHEERYGWALELQASLGEGAELVPDVRTEEERAKEPTGYTTFLAALNRARDGGAWIMEDDALLTDRFPQKARWVVQCHPGYIVQAFSTEKLDLIRGERYRTARTFGSSVCVYFPADIAASIADYGATYENTTKFAHLGRLSDIMVRQYLVSHGNMSYWNAVPSLATHREGHSVRLNRHYKARLAYTFEEKV